MQTKEDIWNFRDFPKWGYFEKEYFEKHRRIFEFMAEDIATPGKDAIILDVGCVTGIGFKNLDSDKRSHIYGVDIVKDFVELFNARGMIGTESDIMKDSLPFNDNFFDAVICGSILEHTLKPKDLISEVSRVVKDDGLLILTVPNAISIRARLNFLRGRNNFRPLIDDLINYDYIKRCGILYSVRELELVLEGHFKIKTIRFLQERKDKIFIEKIYNLIALMLPRMADNIYIVAKKI